MSGLAVASLARAVRELRTCGRTATNPWRRCSTTEAGRGRGRSSVCPRSMTSSTENPRSSRDRWMLRHPCAHTALAATGPDRARRSWTVRFRRSDRASSCECFDVAGWMVAQQRGSFGAVYPPRCAAERRTDPRCRRGRRCSRVRTALARSRIIRVVSPCECYPRLLRIAPPLFPIRADIELVRIARVLLRASSLFRSFSLLAQPRTFRGKGEVFCHLSGQSCTGNAMWCGNGRVCLTLH